MPWLEVIAWAWQAAVPLPPPSLPGLPALEPASIALVSVLITLLWKVYGELQLNRQATDRLGRAILLDLMAHHDPSTQMHRQSATILAEIPSVGGPPALLH